MHSALRYNRPVVWNGPPIRSWAAFHKLVKHPDQPLLAKLDDYADPILVAGCQRSGTTALTRVCSSVYERALTRRTIATGAH